MRPKRKIGLVLLMMSLVLATCGGGQSKEQAGGNEGNQEKVKLTIWHNFAGDDLRAKSVRSFIDQFAQDHPEVTLDAQAIPPDGYRQRLSTVAARMKCRMYSSYMQEVSRPSFIRRSASADYRGARCAFGLER